MNIEQLKRAIEADLNVSITPPKIVAKKFPMIYAIEFYGKGHGIGVVFNFKGYAKTPRRLMEKVTNLMNTLFGYELVKHVRTLQTDDFIQDSIKRERLLFKSTPLKFVD